MTFGRNSKRLQNRVYNFVLYRFKAGAFFPRHRVYSTVHTFVVSNSIRTNACFLLTSLTRISILLGRRVTISECGASIKRHRCMLNTAADKISSDQTTSQPTTTLRAVFKMSLLTIDRRLESAFIERTRPAS